MMIKVKKIFFVLFLVIFILFGLNFIYHKYEISNISKFVPNNLKLFLKKTFFIVPSLKKEISIKDDQIGKLQIFKEKNYLIWKNTLQNTDLDLKANLIEETNININNDNYKFKKFFLFLPDYVTWKGKPVAYIDSYKNNYFLISGDGNIYYFDKNQIKYINKKDTLNFKKINNDLKKFLLKETLDRGKSSIKDIFIDDNNLYISHTNLKSNNCYNIEILKSVLNFDFLYFENFFYYDECFKPNNLHSSGGRITKFTKDKILFSTGEGLVRTPAQDINSIFGKIVSIEKKNGKHKIISMGHRNPQGLFYDIEKDQIISTEHGPAGGDEINIIDTSMDNIPNYGWPISSYGNHYEGNISRSKKNGTYEKLLSDAPLHKSHKKYGFIEPLKYYTPSIGISEIIKINKTESKNNLERFYFLGSMGNRLSEGDMSLHYFKLNKDNKIKNYNIAQIGERIRDIKYDSENNSLLMILENIPSLGIIYFN